MFMKGIRTHKTWTPGAVGAFAGISFADYLAAAGYNKSRLMLLDERFGGCPAKFKAGAEDRETDAMRFGSMVHAFALEGEKPWVISPHASYRTNEAKEWRDAQTLPILTEQQEAAVIATACALRRHPHAWPLIRGGRREVSLWANYGTPSGIVTLKCRPDILQPTHMVDLKTTRDASTHAFGGTLARFGYDLQAAICWKVAALLGFGELDYYLIAVEQHVGADGKPCPLFNVRKLSSASLQAAQVRLDMALLKIAECEASGVWPDYTGPEVGEIEAPAWTMPDDITEQLTMDGASII